ncbi:hypothetical protein PO002_42155 [Cupriavidus necator]|uniref:hypothetical protein n=1 Tax=Cupriavidus necator TaxID=106590 RepID=UPI0039C0818A
MVRVEGTVMPGKSQALGDQIEQMARELTTSVRADAAQTAREIQELSGGALRKSISSPAPRPTASTSGTRGSLIGSPNAGTFVVGGGELEIAVSPDGNNVVIASNSGWSHSTDGGRTFKVRGWRPEPPSSLGDPSLGWGPSGNGSFYYAFIGLPNGTPPQSGIGCAASVARSTDNGQTFAWVGNAALCPLNGTPQGSFCFPDMEHIAVDRVNRAPGGGTSNSDQLYVVWRNFIPNGAVTACTESTNGPPTPNLACSLDGGKTWTLPRVVGTLNGDFPRVTVGSDGFVYVVYMAGRNVMLEKFSSCASGLIPQWSSPIPPWSASAPKNPNAVTVASDVNVACPIAGLDRCWESKKGPSGTASAMVAVDDTNPAHIYVAYANSTETDAAGNTVSDDIIVRDSLDGGVTWLDTNAVVANANVSGRRFMPWVCSSGGAAQVSWYDRRAATNFLSNDITGYFRAAVVRSGGRLNVLTEKQVSPGFGDPQCASGWPLGSRQIGDSESCSGPAKKPSGQPQLAGYCLRPLLFTNGVAAGSQIRCDFDETKCPPGEICQLSRGGVPKYGDYNGNACAAGQIYTAWASATPSVGGVTTVIPPINIFADVSPAPPLCGVAGLPCCAGACNTTNLTCNNGTCGGPRPPSCDERCTQNKSECLASDTGWSESTDGCLCENAFRSCRLACGLPHAPLRVSPAP